MAFAAGLALFLIGHLAYTAVFSASASLAPTDAVIALPLLVFGAVLYRRMSPNLGPMRLPVIFYITIISAMVLTAFSTLGEEPVSRTRGILIASGAVLFYVSDVILAVNRFWKPFRYHRISLAFYFGGQFCLALSASF